MLKNILLVLPIIAIIASILMISMILKEKKNWSTNKNVPVKEIEDRTANRGTFVSIISSIILATVGAIMASFKVPDHLIVTNYGFLLGPVISYMLDIGIGTDEGFSKIKKLKKWFTHIFSSLVTGNFLRYIITVLLDLFISDPIQDVLKKTILPTIKILKDGGRYSKMIADNIPSILQSIVGLITFQAYTNQTRFNWAYPSENLPVENRMNKYIITLVTCLAGCVYLGYYNISYLIEKLDLNKKNFINMIPKIMYVLIAISLIYAMNAFDMAEAPLSNNKIKENIEIKYSKFNLKINFKFILGIIIFAFFLFYGLFIPFSSSKVN